MARCRKRTNDRNDRPVGHRPQQLECVFYTHFHYVSGTIAVDGVSSGNVPVFGHSRITANLARAAGELAPAYSRGLVEQFAIALPEDGADGVIHRGLGLHYRNPAHAPYTVGFVPPSVTFDSPTQLDIAGLPVHIRPAPSDADDSVTLWFPSLDVAVQNLVWPTLFNVFAIRGEEYRDPRILISGIDHLLGLQPQHLVGTHGPPLIGKHDIAVRVTKYRDAHKRSQHSKPTIFAGRQSWQRGLCGHPTHPWATATSLTEPSSPERFV